MSHNPPEADEAIYTKRRPACRRRGEIFKVNNMWPKTIKNNT